MKNILKIIFSVAIIISVIYKNFEIATFLGVCYLMQKD